MTHPDTPQALIDRYAQRLDHERYNLQRPDVWQTVQERQRAMLRLWSRLGWYDLSGLQLLEVGCGSGNNLLELLRMGFASHHLGGVDLLPARCQQARAQLPPQTMIHEGDACTLDVAMASQHVVLASTVFSSLLDDGFQQRLAQAMWAWVRPGGGVLWYDFTVNNPRNRDVRAVPLARVRALFPQGQMRVQRITLAPPLARCVTRWHPCLYTALNVLPWLRTHVLVWIAKT
jgi:SAM-dependent methyltransferase